MSFVTSGLVGQSPSRASLLECELWNPSSGGHELSEALTDVLRALRSRARSRREYLRLINC